MRDMYTVDLGKYTSLTDIRVLIRIIVDYLDEHRDHHQIEFETNPVGQTPFDSFDTSAALHPYNVSPMNPWILFQKTKNIGIHAVLNQ